MNISSEGELPVTAVDRPRSRTIIIYATVVLAVVAGVLVLREWSAGVISPSSAARPQASNIFLHVLIALAAVTILGQVLIRMFAHLKQPPVIGEVVAGILLGPSLLGGALSGLILPTDAAPYLGQIAQLGVVLYMFVVGLDLELGLVGNHARAAVMTSNAGIVVPFALGVALALPLHARFSNSGVPFLTFALFMGVAMSITAFPVLARILTDYGLSRTKLGVIALTCAAANDVTAWCLLAFVSGVARAQASRGLAVAAGALLFIGFMFAAVRPFMKWLLGRWAADNRLRVTTVFVALLLSAIAAEAIGIHALFGAFILGVVMPRSDDAVKAIKGHLEGVVTILLLPAFFAFTGMRTRIDLLSSSSMWLWCLAIIAAATLGKFGGTFVAARLTGLGWHSSSMLGTLMNTRGLMELIVLNVGLELHVISPELFAMMVIMALATTMMASPVVWWLRARTGSTGEADMLRNQ